MSVPTRSLQGARSAFDAIDSEPELARQTSRQVHEMGSPSEDGHTKKDLYLKHFIQGGEKACLTVLSLSAAAKAVAISMDTLVKMGVTFCCAGSLVVGGHRYINATSYAEFYFRERSREAWETQNYMEGEIREMVELYTSRGLNEADAKSIVRMMSKSPRFFVEVMMLEELGLPPADCEGNPAMQAVAKTLGTAVFSAIPLIPIIGACRYKLMSNDAAINTAMVISLVAPLGLSIWECHLRHTPFTLQACRYAALGIGSVLIINMVAKWI